MFKVNNRSTKRRSGVLMADGILYCVDLNLYILESDLGTLSHLRRSSM